MKRTTTDVTSGETVKTVEQSPDVVEITQSTLTGSIESGRPGRQARTIVIPRTDWYRFLGEAADDLEPWDKMDIDQLRCQAAEKCFSFFNVSYGTLSELTVVRKTNTGEDYSSPARRARVTAPSLYPHFRRGCNALSREVYTQTNHPCSTGSV